MNRTLARINPLRRGCGDHTHRFTQLLFGLGGTVHCDLAAGAFDVSAGQIGVVPRNAAHFFIGRDDDSRLLVVDLYMDDDIVREMETTGDQIVFDDAFVTPRSMPVSSELTPMIGCAARQLGRVSAATPRIAQQWATLFAVQAYELLNGATTKIDSRRARLHALIDANLATPPDNRQIQAHLAMSSSALNQWCHLCFGQTPQQVVLRRRLARACDWLRETDRAIAQIAHDVGFADAPTFTRALRRIHATTPAALRRAARTTTPPRALD